MAKYYPDGQPSAIIENLCLHEVVGYEDYTLTDSMIVTTMSNGQQKLATEIVTEAQLVVKASAASILKDATCTLSATLEGEVVDATFESLTPAIATVVGNTVTGIAKGTANIKATYNDGEKDYEKTISIAVTEVAPGPTPPEPTVKYDIYIGVIVGSDDETEPLPDEELTEEAIKGTYMTKSQATTFKREIQFLESMQPDVEEMTFYAYAFPAEMGTPTKVEIWDDDENRYVVDTEEWDLTRSTVVDGKPYNVCLRNKYVGADEKIRIS